MEPLVQRLQRTDKKNKRCSRKFLREFPLVAQAIAEGTITNMEELRTYMEDTAISLEQTLGAGSDMLMDSSVIRHRCGHTRT